MVQEAQTGDMRVTPRTLRAVGTTALLALTALVASLDRWVAYDDAVWRAVLFLRGCGMDRVVALGTTLATRTLAAILVAAVILRARISGFASVWPWLGTCCVGLVASKGLKHVFARERPSSLPDLALGYSFPSAHVMNGVLALIAVLALAGAFRHRGRWYVAASVMMIALATGRILLARHWASDVLGAWLAALALVGLAAPALARRPVLAPLALSVLLAMVFLADRHFIAARLRLSSPLIGRHAAFADVEVGTAMSGFRGTWQSAAAEPPFGSYRWLEGEGSLVVDLPDAAVARGQPMRIAFAGRPRKRACVRISVALNATPIARFVPFVGWREYRFPLPAGLVRPGANDVAITVEGSGPDFGLTYVRLATALSAD